MTTKVARRRFADARANPRATKRVCQDFSTALRRAMRLVAGATVRATADWSGVTPSTVQKHRTSGLLIPYLRSKKLAAPLLEELLSIVRSRNGRSR